MAMTQINDLRALVESKVDFLRSEIKYLESNFDVQYNRPMSLSIKMMKDELNQLESFTNDPDNKWVFEDVNDQIESGATAI